jgi:hypothetical protein
MMPLQVLIILTIIKLLKIMENTIENKAKFFALYWGQEIVVHNGIINKRFKLNEIGDETDYHLQLKPLSSISDEDVIEVAKIINPGSFFTNKKWDVKHIPNEEASYIEITSKRSAHRFEIYYDGYLHVKDEDTDNIPVMSLPNYLGAFDYMRSKSIALPFMGISVEQMVEWGWIKL